MDFKMEGDPENLIRQFKVKVEEAINLLPQIPEEHRKDVWLYWQIISMAVKAAVGGRGPFIAKQSTTTVSRGRPRGRPRQHEVQQSSAVLFSKNVGRNQAADSSSAADSGVSKTGSKGKTKKEKQNLFQCKKSKGDLWSPGQQSTTVKRVHSSDKSNVGDTSVSEEQGSSNADSNGANHVISDPKSTEESKAFVVNDIKSNITGETNASALFQEQASILHTERSSSVEQSKCLSQPDQSLGVGLNQTELSESALSDDCKVHSVNYFQSTDELHDKQSSDLGKEQQANIFAQVDISRDEPLKLTSDNMKADDDLHQRPETMVVSLEEIVQSTSASDETNPQIMITVKHEMEVSAASEVEAMTSITDSDSAAQQNVTFGSLLKSEDGSEGNTSVPVQGSSSSDVNQPHLSPAAHHSQTVGIPQNNQSIVPATDNTVNVITNAEATEKSSGVETKPEASLCGFSTTSLKRKLGRPRKITADNPHQNLLASTSSSSPSSQMSHQSEKTHKASVVSESSEENGKNLIGTILLSPSKMQQRNNFTTIVSDPNVKHNSRKACRESEERSSKMTVRRSERRAIPKRDEIFSYFALSYRGKLKESGGAEEVREEVEKDEEEEEKEEGEEDEESDGREEEVEEDGDDDKGKSAKEVNREVRVKTEEEKRKERSCPKCHVVLKSVSSLSAHMRVHTGERPFSCPVCHKSFTTKGNCERHEVTHVGLKAFSCLQCGKKFTEKKSLKIHMRAHTGERPYECQVCGMRFFQSGTLKTHMDRHTGHKGHLCDLCGKAFRQSCQLRVHMRRHKMHMPYQCQHCFNSFYTKSDMERHELRHTGERPYSCDQCSKTFTRMQYLREHQNSHLGHRPYRCVVCGMSFHTFAACHRHVNKHKLPAVATAASAQASDTPQQQQPSVQQIHVEVAADTPTQQVMEQVQVILNQHQQQLTAGAYHHHHHHHPSTVQTFIIPDPHQAFSHTSHSHTASTSTHTITGPSPSPSHHQQASASTTATTNTTTILSNLGLEVEDASEIYHVTLVDSGGGHSITLPLEHRMASSSSSGSGGVSSVVSADFSAINLLANATTQLSAPPP